MKVSISYELRGQRISAFMTYPELTERNHQDALKHIAWVMQQEKPEVEVIHD